MRIVISWLSGISIKKVLRINASLLWIDSEPVRGLLVNLYMQRGITFGDPFGGTLQYQITPFLVSLARVFIFHLSSPIQVRLSHLENKNPADNCGSNLILRREGDYLW